MKLYAKCINKDNKDLTIGKTYEYFIKENNNYSWIENDGIENGYSNSGNSLGFSKMKFLEFFKPIKSIKPIKRVIQIY